jgi:hypothetical protein
MPRKRGVYFIANDNYLELAIAFLNSFRSHNPKIPLCLIPFDDNFQQFAPLQSRYSFSIWNDAAILRQCDEISLSFHDRPRGHYRKLATWEGEYDEFLYIDSDTVILKTIDFVFDYLNEFSFVVATSNIPGRAWKESICKTDKLTPQQIGFAANTGFISSKKGCLGLCDVISRLPAATELATHMKLGYEQPLLNYLMVTSGMPYTSLREIRKTTGNPNIPGELFAWTPGIVAQDGHVVYPESPPPLLVHWTEPVKPTQREKRSIPLYELWEFYYRMSLDP